VLARREHAVTVAARILAPVTTLAAALVGYPPLLVLDEPSAGLDVEARVDFDRLLRRLCDGRRTVMLASHLLGDVETTRTHLAIMLAGRVIVAGGTGALLEDSRGQTGTEVHVDATHAGALAALGLAHEPSRYPGLLLVRSDLSDLDLLRALVGAGVAPRRMEPRAGLVALYLAVTGEPPS
jgi:ABC-2 type transport system ATP-binding protein